ncbi:MAG: hypothetical protein QOH03_2208 [Kribbellaceae bacterium]|nr:hypothetical protein [Kribbellaceae bacterium]
MTSPATTRYSLDPAPDTLTLAQDLLNTRGVGAQPDLLADVPTASTWLAQVLPGAVEVSAADLEQLRAFRAELHRFVTPEAAEPEERAPGAPTPVTVARSASAELVLGADGLVELRAGGDGAEYVISRVLAEVLSGQQVDTWRRLKACKNDRCRVVFYDRSRNNSGVWHSLKTCGNPANLRAFRARNKEVSG